MKKTGFKNKLKQNREGKGITYPAFSEDTGTTIKNIVNIEKGQQPGVQLAYRIVSALGLKPKSITEIFPPER